MNNKQKNIRAVVFFQNTVAGITASSENSHK
jgi:hypothetical protein